jgi:hypothetical protein
VDAGKILNLNCISALRICDLQQYFEQITKTSLHKTENEIKLNVTPNTLHTLQRVLPY